MEADNRAVPIQSRVKEFFRKHKAKPWAWALFILWLIYFIGSKIALVYGGAKLLGF